MVREEGFLVTQNVVARVGAGFLGMMVLAGVAVTAQSKPQTILVYKTPTCGCCTKWVEHLQAAGFKVETQHRDDLTPIRQAQKVPPTATSCHTALVGPYVVEGHVPAADVKRMLAEQPKIKGIAVPGMPIGSPGMEGPAPQKYDTLAFTETGKITVFAKH
jgi:hypothetical protein